MRFGDDKLEVESRGGKGAGGGGTGKGKKEARGNEDVKPSQANEGISSSVSCSLRVGFLSFRILTTSKEPPPPISYNHIVPASALHLILTRKKQISVQPDIDPMRYARGISYVQPHHHHISITSDKIIASSMTVMMQMIDAASPYLSARSWA